MKIFLPELKKIVKQIFGLENIFGYKSTVANQLYWLYCFGGGNIYFTDRVYKKVKYFWCSLVFIQLLFSYTLGLTYLWYDDKNDFVLMLNVANSFGIIHAGAVGLPLISYLYRDNIESVIKYVDGLLDSESSCSFNQNVILEEARKFFSLFLIPMVLFAFLYLFACLPDVLLFFEEDKVGNYFYYAFPPPLVQKYSNFASYIMMTSITTILFMLTVAQGFSAFGLIFYWNTICSVQLINVKNDLHTKTSALNMYSDEEVQHLREYNRVYKYVLKREIKEFQKATRLIHYLREFSEAIDTIIITVAFCYGVALLYVCFSIDMSFMLKVKCLTGYLVNGIVAFMFYWSGQNVDNSVSEISLAVYFTPWYRSVEIRKDICILICQTQSLKNFKIFKVYPLLLNNFSRYLHGLVSYTNILLQLTRK